MGGVIYLVALSLVGIGVGAVLLYGTRGAANEWPARGTNTMQPGFGMVWWRRPWFRRSSSVPTAEEAMGPHYDLLTVDHQLEELNRHHGVHHHPAASGMEEPGALERAGLTDAPDPPPSADHPATHHPPHPHHGHSHHHPEH